MRPFRLALDSIYRGVLKLDSAKSFRWEIQNFDAAGTYYALFPLGRRIAAADARLGEVGALAAA